MSEAARRKAGGFLLLRPIFFAGHALFYLAQSSPRRS